MDNKPKLLIKVENETGDEILRLAISVDIAGRFLEYLGTQLRPPVTAHPMPPHIPSKVEKEGKDHA